MLAAIAAAMCVLTGIQAVTSAKTPTTAVVVVTREIPTGTVLAEADVTVRRVRTVDLPDRAITDAAAVIGKAVGSQMSRGSILTIPAVTASRAASGPDRVLIAVKTTEAEVARLVAPGMRVVLLAPGPAGGVLTDDALVVAVPQATSSAPFGAGGESRVIIVDIQSEAAERLVRSSAAGGVTLALR